MRTVGTIQKVLEEILTTYEERFSLKVSHILIKFMIVEITKQERSCNLIKHSAFQTFLVLVL